MDLALLTLMACLGLCSFVAAIHGLYALFRLGWPRGRSL